MHIAFVTVADYPEGGGRTARIRSVVEGLHYLGHRVTIFNEHALGATPGQQVNGQLAGAEFEYVLGTTERHFGFAATWLKLKAVRRVITRLSATHADEPFDAVLCEQLSFHDLMPITLWARRRSIAAVHCYEDERMEVVSDQRLGVARRMFGVSSRLADRYCSPLADALIVASTYLKRKYDPLSGDPDKVYVVPTIIDCAAWRAPLELATDCPTIFYAGTFSEQDDLETLVAALRVVHERGHRFRLLMVGADFNVSRVGRLKEQIHLSGLTDHVTFRGHVPQSAVKQAMADSHVLFGARRDTAWSRSGMSIKLSEYLASGRLVIASAVGDNSLYLQNGVSALLLPAGSSLEQWADAIEAALTSPALRFQVGAEGRRVAETCFDIEVVADVLQQVIACALHSASLRVENPRPAG